MTQPTKTFLETPIVLKFIGPIISGDSFLFVNDKDEKITLRISNRVNKDEMLKQLNSLKKNDLCEITGYLIVDENNKMSIYATSVSIYDPNKSTQTTEEITQTKLQETQKQTFQSNMPINDIAKKIEEYAEKSKIDTERMAYIEEIRTEKLVYLEEIKSGNMLTLNAGNNATQIFAEFIKKMEISDPEKIVRTIEEYYPRIYSVIFETMVNNLQSYRESQYEQYQQQEETNTKEEIKAKTEQLLTESFKKVEKTEKEKCQPQQTTK